MKQISIRQFTRDDEQSYRKLREELDSDSAYWGASPGERFQREGSLTLHLDKISGNPGSTIFVAEYDYQVIGFLLATSGEWQRNKHVVSIDMGISLNFRRQGICSDLYKTFEIWGVQQGIHRIELFVSELNTRALSLYCKLGFEVEGIRKDWLLVGDEYVNWLWMSKLI